ncbi:ankyrin repeat domain-containing protein [Candidatus Dependentiae bacterium]|nr:MAG: ankyrin repeat domain-containing protein [Candidatus Dependentiae bacterium]
MQKKSVLFLWLTLLGTVAVIEAVPDDSPRPKENWRPSVSSPYQRLLDLDRPQSAYGQWVCPLDDPSANISNQEVLADLNKRLREALAHKDIKQAIRLIRDGANPNEKSEEGNTLLHFAAGRDHLSVAKWLIEKKRARTDIRNAYKRTPLELAIILKKTRIAQLLQAWRPSSSTPHDRPPQNATSPTERAFIKKYNIVKKEMQAMVAQQRHSSSPIYQLCEQLRAALFYDKDQETATQLIMKGADPNTQETFSGNTILHIAALQGKYDCIKKLFESGYRPNPNVKNERGQTVLHILALDKDPIIATRATRSFLNRENGRTPADVCATDISGKTALEYATQAGNERMVRVLLKHTEPGHQSIGLARAKAHKNKKIVALFAKYPDVSKLSKSGSDDDDKVIYTQLGKFNILSES